MRPPLAIGALVLALAPAVARAQECPSAALLERAESADRALREAGDCPAGAVAALAAAADELTKCLPREEPAKRWKFPVANMSPELAMGGRNGSSYIANRPKLCFAHSHQGHPAHDLFVWDGDHDCRDKDGNPFPAVAVEDGVVLVTREGWQPGDTSKGGNYVVLFLPARGVMAYYAHLESVAVKAGQKVKAGEVLGSIGRTGLNANKRRSPTHLHFAVFDARNFRPQNPYKLLAGAEKVESLLAAAPTSGP